MDATSLEGTMGSRLSDLAMRQARRIASERDYEAARALLVHELQEPGWTRAHERIDALIWALREYESCLLTREINMVVEWAEFVFVPALEPGDTRPRRRWQDVLAHSR
jgi:aminoglycoside/choline kinase family phosphotransferase